MANPNFIPRGPYIKRRLCKCGCGYKIEHENKSGYRQHHQPLSERLWPYVAITANPDKCWEWQRGLTKAGYGRMTVKSKPAYCHRIAWELTHGEIPPKMEICHTCDNPKCCNPNHLFLGTHQDNMRDRDQKKRHRSGRKVRSLPISTVIAIRTLFDSGVSIRDIANQFNAKYGNIWKIVTRKTFRNM